MNMSPTTILLIGTDDAETRRIQELLAPTEALVCATTNGDALAAELTRLGAESFAAIVVDVTRPDDEACAVFQDVLAHAPPAPIIALVAEDDEALTEQLLRQGAQECLVKTRLDRAQLNAAIRRAGARHHALADSARQFRLFFERQHALMLIVHPDSGVIRDANWAAAAFYGYPRDRLRGMNIADLCQFPAAEAEQRRQQLIHASLGHYTCPQRLADGAIHIVETYSSPLELHGETFLIDILHDVTDQARGAELVQHAEMRYHDIYQNAVEGIFQSAPAGHFLSVNPAMARIFGYTSPEEMLTSVGDQIATRIYLSAESRAAFMQALQQQGVVLGFEAPNRRKDGSVIWTRTNARAVYDAGGALQYYEGLLEDITEHRRMENMIAMQRNLSALLAEAADLKQAIQALLTTVCTIEGIDCGGVYLAAPDGALDLAACHGLPPEFTGLAAHYDPDSYNVRMVEPGRPLYGRHPEMHHDANPALLQERLRTLAVIPICHAGQVIAVLNLASHSHDEIPTHTRLALETIAAQVGGALARLSAQTALKESQENPQAFFDTIDDFVFVADAAGQILNTNAVVRTRLGYSADELRRVTVWDLHPAGRRDAVSATLADMLAGRSDICRIPLCSKDGAHIPVETRVTHGHWSGQPVLLGISRDITERQRLEEALQAQVHFTQHVINTTPDVIYIYDLGEQRLVYANRQAAAILGYTPTAIQALDASFLPTHMHPDDWPRIQENLRCCAQAGDGEVLTVEYRLRDVQGRWHWFADRQMIFKRDTDGALRQIIGTAEDITERKAAEDTLRRTATQLSEAQRLARLGSWDWDLPAQTLTWSDEVYRIFGVTPSEFAPSAAVFENFIHPDDRADFLRRRAEMLAETNSAIIEHRIIRRDGEVRYVQERAQVLRDAAGQAIRVTGTVQDITERKRAEEALRESEEKFRTIAEQITEMIYITDTQGTINYVSPAAASIFEYTPGEMQGHVFTDFLAETDLPKAVAAFTGGLATGKSSGNLELRMKRKDGSVFAGELNGTLYRKGGIAGTIGLIRDITARKQAEEAQRRRAAELAALQATLLEITAPHDLPTLLRTIVERAAQLLGARGGGMYLCDPGRREVRCVVSYNTPRDYAGTILAYGEGAAGTVAQTGEPLMIDDYRVWSNRAAVYDKEQPFTTVLSAPMIWQGQVTGVIHVLDDVESKHFTEPDLALLTLFANHAVIAVENARLYEAAQKELAERKAAEAARRESEEKYRTLFREMLDGFALHEILCDGQGNPADYRFLAINPAFERMTGLKAQDVLGQTVLEVLPGTERYWIETYGKVALSGEPIVFENYSAELKKHFQVTAFRPAPNQFAGIFADITERKRLERELQDERDFALQVFNTVGQGLTVTDAENRFVRVNPAYARLFGDAPQELLGKRPADLTAPEDHAVLAQARLDRKQGKTTTYESRLIRKDGSYAHVLITGAPRLKDGRYAGTIAAIADITERKQAEEALRKAHDDLARSNTDLERFAYVASHDLQEPLRMVASFVQLLGERYRGQLDADADEFIGFAVDGAKRMQTLINDLLEYSRVGTRGEPLQPTDANIALDDALWNLDLAITDAGATITHDPLPTVIADPTQLAQLFQNLVSNAIKFHGTEPPVVHVSAQETFEVSETSKVWRFSIRDNGIGIAPADHDRIFGIFQRLHSREEYAGTGIGLAVYQRIVERLDVRIWVESQVGQGTTFFFTLPSSDL